MFSRLLSRPRTRSTTENKALDDDLFQGTNILKSFHFQIFFKFTSAVFHPISHPNRGPGNENDQLHKEHEARLEKAVVGLHVPQTDEAASIVGQHVVPAGKGGKESNNYSTYVLATIEG